MSALVLRVFILLLLLITTHTVVQAQSYKQWEKAAQKFEETGNYAAAAFAWSNIYFLDSANIHTAYRYAENLRKSWNYNQAVYYYQKVYKQDRGREFPEALFWLGVIQKDLGDYVGAKKSFRRAFNKFRRDKTSYPYLRITRETENFKMLDARGKRDSVEVQVNVVNQMPPRPVYGASVVDSTLVFSSFTFDDTLELARIFTAMLVDSGKTASRVNQVSITDTIAWHESNPARLKDFDYIYFSRCERPGSCKIWKGKIVEARISNAEELKGGINTATATSTHPQISLLADGTRILFFSSDRDKPGNMDLFFTRLNEDGDPTAILSAGDSINTPGAEVTPYYDAEEGRLYFSSDFQGGYGGFDIFSAEGVPGSFKKPYNLLPPFNTYSNDLYLVKNGKSQGYFVSNRPEGDEKNQQWACGNRLFHFKSQTSEEIDTITVEDALSRLKKYIPLTLYFHNDEPEPRTTDTLTGQTYLETFEKYMKLQELYASEYSKGLSREEAEDAVIEINSFFEDYVSSGAKDLNDFSEILEEVLASGLEVTLTIKGYASTLAKSDYNVNLARRRISSLKNHLATFNEGVFQPYLEDTASSGGSLVIEELPYGEFKAGADVSDNLNDLRNSVYSKRAALERKIEILAVEVTDTDSDSLLPIPLRSDTLSHDFGELNYGESTEHIFQVYNPGTSPLTLTGAMASCGCTVAELPDGPIMPGEYGKVKVRFDSRGKFGLVKNQVLITTNGTPDTILLEFTVVVKNP